jgi:hypothetical protein
MREVRPVVVSIFKRRRRFQATRHREEVASLASELACSASDPAHGGAYTENMKERTSKTMVEGNKNSNIPPSSRHIPGVEGSVSRRVAIDTREECSSALKQLQEENAETQAW